MIYHEFPAPVTIEDTCLVVHRRVAGEHHDTRTCWCCPAVFTQEELDSLTPEQFNARFRHGVH